MLSDTGEYTARVTTCKVKYESDFSRTEENLLKKLPGALSPFHLEKQMFKMLERCFVVRVKENSDGVEVIGGVA